MEGVRHGHPRHSLRLQLHGTNHHDREEVVKVEVEMEEEVVVDVEVQVQGSGGGGGGGGGGDDGGGDRGGALSSLSPLIVSDPFLTSCLLLL